MTSVIYDAMHNFVKDTFHSPYLHPLREVATNRNVIVCVIDCIMEYSLMVLFLFFIDDFTL